jgi:hypothetical protein
MNDHPDSLDRLIANLPKDIAPPANVWPRIASRLSRRPRYATPVTLAAAIAVAAAGVASLFTWAVLQGPSVPRVIQTVAATSAFEEPRDPKYLLARNTVEKTFRERLALLEPATRAKIEWRLTRRVPYSSSFGRAPCTTKLTCTTASFRRPNPP